MLDVLVWAVVLVLGFGLVMLALAAVIVEWLDDEQRSRCNPRAR